MIENWLQPVERIILSTIEGGQRVVGITSNQHGAGVSTLSEMMAETLARSNLRVLLVDLTAPTDASWPTALATDEVDADDADVETQDADDAVEIADEVPVSEDRSDDESAMTRDADENAINFDEDDDQAADVAEDNPVDEHSMASWSPGAGDVMQAIWREQRGFDCLVARPTQETRFHFNNVDTLRRTFRDELALYDAVIVDLPPVTSAKTDNINPVAAAASCDAVLMVCVAGRVTEAQATISLELLKSGGAPVIGTVMNDVVNPTLGSEVARESRKLAGVMPGVARWIEKRASASEFLNS